MPEPSAETVRIKININKNKFETVNLKLFLLKK